MIMTAKQVLDTYWNNTVPVDPVAIANKAGIKVYTASNMPKELSGIIQKDKQNDNVIIIVNGNHDERRQRFTIAHELGHYFNTEDFDGQIDDSTDILIYNSDNKSSPIEVEANKFAAELLMPQAAIKYMLATKDIKTLSEFADIFNVSPSAMNIRLINMGII